MRLSRRTIESVPVDIAPLIDVVFQLLLFFMLSSSFVVHPGIRVTLPPASTSRPLVSSRLTITLTKDHLIYWNHDLVTLKELRRKLEEADHEQSILIRSDQHAYVEKLIDLWDLCREIGYSQVHIATLSE